MKVQATKKMTDEINKFFKEKKIPYEAVYETMSPAAYKWNVDTFDDHDDDYLTTTMMTIWRTREKCDRLRYCTRMNTTLVRTT